MSDQPTNTQNELDRRDFLKSATALGASALTASHVMPSAYAGETDKLRIGLIGCGSRGTLDARNCLNAAPGVELHAMGDLFAKRRGRDRQMGMDEGYAWLKEQVGEKMNVPKERRFVGWDAYKKVLETDVDLVLLTTPPHFRPMQFRAAIEAGKHVFIEKPVAVDPVGVRSVIETSKLADQKGLGVLAGTQMRHRADYQAVMERIHNGWIGDLVAGQAYYNTGGLGWQNQRYSDMSDIEWQLRNWLYFDWASGDFIVEQSVHKIDILNWAFGGPPKRAYGTGGRHVRTGEINGNIYDHFTVEFDYGNNVHAVNQCRHWANASHRMGEFIIGTKGKAVPTGSYGLKLIGEHPWQLAGSYTDPSVQEHTDFIKSIRAGSPINEGQRIAESTLTGIMGRMSAYTGKAISWDWIRHKSQLQLGPDSYGFGSFTPREVAMPGQRQLV
jgi:predicted dehydrogenase